MNTNLIFVGIVLTGKNYYILKPIFMECEKNVSLVVPTSVIIFVFMSRKYINCGVTETIQLSYKTYYNSKEISSKNTCPR